MQLTKHVHQRMNQRGITGQMLELAITYGDYDGDKLLLNRKMISLFLREIESLKAKLLKVMDKGGVVLGIGDDGQGITTYNYDSYRRNK